MATKKEERVINILECPPPEELVARKTIKFSLKMTGGDVPLGGNLYVAATLVCSSTLKQIENGLMDEKVKLKKSPALQPKRTDIMQKIIPYKETSLKFQIVRGTSKKVIKNNVKFELRFYKKNNEGYKVIHSVLSPSYRILTHSSQLGRKK
uniref:Uncharacterized protein n=1 Tax=Marseillevirus LCMAC101 TaxID=2506602 RepID=A0A481YS42_9VIRU|nr:MAG: hypothetical protein LCMAC101_06030 [Marseillevirus LCMAC101]